jgi:hypothetical protein
MSGKTAFRAGTPIPSRRSTGSPLETSQMRILVAAALGLGLVSAAACSKPSEPSNPAVAAEQNQEKTATTPGDNSFTSDQAKGHIENAGYTNVSDLTQDDKGAWTGTATKDGKQVSVSVDYQGGVTAK